MEKMLVNQAKFRKRKNNNIWRRNRKWYVRGCQVISIQRNFRHSFHHDLGTKSNKRLGWFLGQRFRKNLLCSGFYYHILHGFQPVSWRRRSWRVSFRHLMGIFLFASIYNFQSFYMGFWCFHKKEIITSSLKSYW